MKSIIFILLVIMSFSVNATTIVSHNGKMIIIDDKYAPCFDDKVPNKKKPDICFQKTESPPETKYITITGTLVMGGASVIVSQVLGFTPIQAIATGLLTSGITYYYLNSFEGPLYEQNEKDVAEIINQRKEKIKNLFKS